MLNDKMLERKEGLTPSKKKTTLADKHICGALLTLNMAISELRDSINLTSGSYAIPVDIKEQKDIIISFRESCYNLFFVCKPLLKFASEEVRKEVDAMPKRCADIIGGVHPLNKML